MSPAGGVVIRAAARTVMAALLLALVLQFAAMSREDREKFWLTGSLCTRSAASAR